MDANIVASQDAGVPDNPDFMLAMLDGAMTRIREALRKGERNAASWLAHGNEDDTKATAAALLSAWDSFVRHLDEDEAIVEDMTMENLAAIYIRLAYNRLRRKIYQDERVQQQVSRANVRGKDGDYVPFDPSDSSSREEVMKNLPDEIAIELSGRSERDRLVIDLWVGSHANGKLTYEEIVGRVKKARPGEPISIATVQRIVERFRDDMRRRLKDE